jgi:hypothetical protein
MDISDKIRKLLAIAECESASEAEKATALHQASRLAEKHAIDLDALGREASDFGSVELCEFTKRVPPWVSPINAVVAEHFNVRVYRERSVLECEPPQYNVVFRYRFYAFGCKPSRDVSVYAFTFLRREFLHLASKHKPASKAGFFRSLALGVDSRLQALRQKSTVEERQNSLILVSKLEAEFKVASEGFGNMRLPPKADLSREAYLLGKNIELNPALAGDHVLRIEG